MNGQNAMRCGLCKSWKREVGTIGRCHAHAPDPYHFEVGHEFDPPTDRRERITVWPQTRADDWCGEFEFDARLTATVELEARLADAEREASITGRPVGAVLDFLHENVEIVDEAATEMTEFFLAYVAWCKTKNVSPIYAWSFLDELEKIGIRSERRGEGDFLLSVRVVSRVRA